MLLRLLFEQTYGTHLRVQEKEKDVAEARMAARYQRSKQSIPIDPNYKPE